MFQRKDWIIGVVSLIIGIAVFSGARQWTGMTALDPAGPAAVPMMLAAGIVIIGIIHFIGAWMAPKEPEATGAKHWVAEYKPVMHITLVCGAYNLVLEHLGYLLATPLLIMGVMWVFQVRNIKEMLKTGVMTTLVLYGVFHYGLNIKIPVGIFEGVIR